MQIRIHDLDTDLVEALTRRATRNRRTPAEEARAILRQALKRPFHDQLGDRMHYMLTRQAGGVELDLPARVEPPRIPALVDPPRLPEGLA